MDFKTNYLNTLRMAEKIRSNPKATTEDLAHADWLLETCRGDEISRRISIKHPLNAQVALLMDRDEKTEEWDAYQTFRAEVKEAVDAEIAEINKNNNI